MNCLEQQEAALSTAAWKQLRSLTSVDLVVGIPSYNCAHTINYVAYQAAKGLATFFSAKKTVILVSDGGSTDGTVAVVKAMKTP